MFEFIRKVFDPTIKERIENEVRLARKLTNQTMKEMQRWAKNPIGYQIKVYIGFANNRVKSHLIDMINVEICKKYDCEYYFDQYGWLEIDASFNTSALILQELLQKGGA
jgi:hypothetical protein